jgi:hypothetical protein
MDRAPEVAPDPSGSGIWQLLGRVSARRPIGTHLQRLRLPFPATSELARADAVLLTRWLAVPAGEYSACAQVAASDGYLAAALFFVAGLIVTGIFGNRNEYLKGLRKLKEEEEKDHPAADP